MRREAVFIGPEPAVPPGLDHTYLAREVVLAERQAAWFARQLISDRADLWLEYLDRCLWWLYCANRGSMPPDLQICPDCGHLDQFGVGAAVCIVCGHAWVVFRR